MHQLPLQEILGATLECWYARVAEWRPPGAAITGSCRECAESVAAPIVDGQLWPHSIVHQLTVELAILEARVSESLSEERFESATPRSPEVAMDARRLVADGVWAASGDIVDVLDHCLRPRLDAWVLCEVESALDALSI
jgi:hypothetical protein